jgi:hypothetical protein
MAPQGYQKEPQVREGFSLLVSRPNNHLWEKIQKLKKLQNRNIKFSLCCEITIMLKT